MITYSNQISVEQYNDLRKSVGWNEIKHVRAEKGLTNSICFVANDKDKPIGMARLITDEGYVSCIFDVIVHPDYQGQGIGSKIMNSVMEYIMDGLEEGENQMICLLAMKGKEEFYKRFGFQERPNEASGAGMSQWIKKTF